MSSPEVEEIGLAGQTPEADDAIQAELSEPPGQRAAAPVERPPQASRRVHPALLLVLLLIVAALAWAYGNEVQRVEQLQSRVAFLGEELESAHSELLAHEQQMGDVRSAVDDLTGRMSALQALVNQPIAEARD